MPKSSKKRKEKAADFAKAKLKLGKGKKVPSNVVDTSFKARSIALPMQSITVEKDDVPTTRRKQTFGDILSLLKHHNAGVRKDAIFSVKELFNGHPDIIPSSMAALFSACSRLIGDTDAGVRKALLAFLEWLLVRVAKNDLIPHVPQLLLFTTSAQTHIFPEIRVDAVRYLDLFLGVLPEYVVMGWNESGPGLGRRILDGYLGLLNVSTKFGEKTSDGRYLAKSFKTGPVLIYLKSRLVVLRSLSKFLCCAVCRRSVTEADVGNQGPATSSVPTWFLRPFFATTRLYEEHGRLFKGPCMDNQGKQMFWTPEPASDPFDEDFVYNCDTVTSLPVASSILTELSDCFADRDNYCASAIDVDFLMRLARVLHPTLIASYLDCAPITFSPGVNPSDTDLQLLTAAMEITRTLYSVILQDATATHCDDLKGLLGHLSGYFPFRPAHRDAKVEQAFQHLSVIYCELVSLLVLVLSLPGLEPSSQGDSRTRSSLPHIKVDKKLRLQTESIRAYIVRLLKGEGEPDVQLPRPLTPTVYIALLPSIWALLNHLDGPNIHLDEVVSSNVLSAVLEHAIRTTSTSAVKHPTIEFVARLLLLEKERGYVGFFKPGGAAAEEKWLQWVLHLPRVLWELGDSNSPASVTLIQTLLRLLQRGSFVVRHEHVAPLCARLVPFFTITHPSRGKIPGPFRKLATSSPRAGRLALDLSATLLAERAKDASDDSNSGSYQDFDDAICAAIKGTVEEEYWSHVTGAMCPCSEESAVARRRECL
ncbi:hypothetical protein PISMIDRAFT_90735 [Pisolithus microcarpus 441]|uniref:Pre-rRNA-processing protein n=1 Tax=Pisolithus microcarpus 441 TaxID=765257 RepID=A0A0D0A201_9AGAM|nr:hypothetical protein PISMIDRAFT_90735 [Pisolithus microcarpus 441]